MGLNGDLLQDRFEDIRQSLARLEAISKLSLDDFLADQDIMDLACYRLLVAIEATIQICFHVSARHAGRIPQEYAECFAILGESGILDPDLTRNLQGMARFRNLLIHHYWEMDYQRIHQILQGHLDDFRKFMKAVAEML